MSNNEDQKESVIPTTKKDITLLERLTELEKRVNLTEARLEAIDSYAAKQVRLGDLKKSRRRA